jgi:hypothetical protein
MISNVLLGCETFKGCFGLKHAMSQVGVRKRGNDNGIKRTRSTASIEIARTEK